MDEAGKRYLVKSQWSADGVAATELLRAEGFPAPRYVLVRPGLSVQEELPGETLAERIRADVVRGHHYVDLALLERASPELLRRCRNALSRAEDSLADPGDLVHWDYTTANILAVGAEITGVVDWDGVCNGDRLFDLVTLWYYTRTPILRDYVLAHTTRAVYAAYLGAVVVRQVAYSLKFHSPSVAPDLIADALDVTA